MNFAVVLLWICQLLIM